MHRCSCYRAAEQARIPYGMFHSCQKQHEGHPLRLRPHLTPIPLLLASAETPPFRRRRPQGAAPPTGTQASPTFQTWLGAKLRPLTDTHKLEHTCAGWAVFRQRFGRLCFRPRGLPEETLPLDLRRTHTHTHIINILFRFQTCTGNRETVYLI